MKLHLQYGVCHFARYTYKMLSSALKHQENKPTFTIINAYADHNAANYYNRHLLHNSINKIEDLFNFNIIETGDGTNLYLKIKKLRETPEGNHLDLLLVSGHGKPDKIGLGTKEMGEHAEVTTALLSSRVLRLISRILDRKTIIIFKSCSVGNDHGGSSSFAQTVFSGGRVQKVIAPQETIYGLSSLTIKWNNQKMVDADASFIKKDTDNDSLKLAKKSVYSRQ